MNPPTSPPKDLQAARVSQNLLPPAMLRRLRRGNTSPSGAPVASATATLPESRRRHEPPAPVLRFTPTAWAKLLLFCHFGETEIGGFAITGKEDLLLVEDFQSVHQRVSSVTVAFEDTAVADFFEYQVDQGRSPAQFARIWCHTHPGESPYPSGTDEETFQRVFGACDWAVMFILAKGGKTYARLRFNCGPGAAVIIPVEVDYHQPFGPSDTEGWIQEYLSHVHPLALGQETGCERPGRPGPASEESLLEELENAEHLARLYWA